MLRMIRLCLVSAAALLAAAAPASAHHSFAMFDQEKSVTLDGSVVEWQWTNPHTWLQLKVKDAAGKETEYSIEASSPNNLARRGWKRTSLKPGDHATVTIHPLKDGKMGGSLIKASVNGAAIGTSGPEEAPAR